MKQQKWSLRISVLCSIVSLGMYFIGAFACANGGDVVKDIFIAIFSSSIFVVALSAIGYVVEKQRLIENIRKSSASLVLDVFFSVANNSYENYFQINRSGMNTVLTTIIDRLKNVKFLMEEYYYGCIRNDGSLFKKRFDELLPKYTSCSDAIDAWIESKVEYKA